MPWLNFLTSTTCQTHPPLPHKIRVERVCAAAATFNASYRPYFTPARFASFASRPPPRLLTLLPAFSPSSLMSVPSLIFSSHFLSNLTYFSPLITQVSPFIYLLLLSFPFSLYMLFSSYYSSISSFCSSPLLAFPFHVSPCTYHLDSFLSSFPSLLYSAVLLFSLTASSSSLHSSLLSLPYLHSPSSSPPFYFLLSFQAFIFSLPSYSFFFFFCFS